MTKLRSNEVAAYCAKLDPTFAASLDALSDEEFDYVERVLISALIQSDDAEIESTASLDHAALKSLVLIEGTESKPAIALSFAIKDAAASTALPLLGLLAAVCVGSAGWKEALAGAGVVKTVWSNFSLLKEPGDREAIAVLRALLQAKAARRDTSPEDCAPTATEIGEAAGLDAAPLLKQLKSLAAKKIIEVRKWADQKGDDVHPGNRWAVRL